MLNILNNITNIKWANIIKNEINAISYSVIFGKSLPSVLVFSILNVEIAVKNDFPLEINVIKTANNDPE